MFHAFTFVHVFVCVTCEQMNLSGSDKVVIKNSISGSRFVVSSPDAWEGVSEKGRKRRRWDRQGGCRES